MDIIPRVCPQLLFGQGPENETPRSYLRLQIHQDRVDKAPRACPRL